MSQENVEVVRRANQHLSDTGDLDPQYYDPEVEYTPQPDGPIRTTYGGFNGLRRSLDSVQEAWSSMAIEEREVVASGDAVVMVLRFRLRSHSGVELEVDQAWAYRLRNGRMWWIEQHAHKAEALEAVGLSE